LWLDNPETGEAGSAGSNADDSEWVVFDQNTWDYVGSHPHDFDQTQPTQNHQHLIRQIQLLQFLDYQATMDYL
jgi:hypothetical protein